MVASIERSEESAKEMSVAVVPVVGEGRGGGLGFDSVPWLPCTLALDIPVINFTISHLLKLMKGAIVETSYHQSSDLPLRANGQLVGWTEFEVVGDRLAVRLTDLS